MPQAIERQRCIETRGAACATFGFVLLRAHFVHGLLPRIACRSFFALRIERAAQPVESFFILRMFRLPYTQMMWIFQRLAEGSFRCFVVSRCERLASFFNIGQHKQLTDDLAAFPRFEVLSLEPTERLTLTLPLSLQQEPTRANSVVVTNFRRSAGKEFFAL